LQEVLQRNRSRVNDFSTWFKYQPDFQQAITDEDERRIGLLHAKMEVDRHVARWGSLYIGA